MWRISVSQQPGPRMHHTSHAATVTVPYQRVSGHMPEVSADTEGTAKSCTQGAHAVSSRVGMACPRKSQPYEKADLR